MEIPKLCRTWHPVLRGELLERAEACVRGIVTALPAPEVIGSPTLSGGAAGIGLFLSWYSRCRSDPGAGALAAAHLDRATDALAETIMLPSFYAGFSGIAWSHLQGLRLCGVESAPEDADAIDDALLEILKQRPWRYDYELIRGLVGFGVYLLERLPGVRAAHGLELIVDHLAEISERRQTGLAWHTPVSLLPPHVRHRYASGYDNLGVAHGVPGVIALLAGVMAHGLGGSEARLLLESAVEWLLDPVHRMDDVAGFPCYAGIPEEREPARLAWCYGDAGIAGALAAAALALDDPWLKESALAIGRRAALCPAERSGVVDAGLCHGAAGVAHIFNRLFQVSHEESFRDAAAKWFERTLEFHRPGSGIAGWSAWQVDSDGSFDWRADPGLLEGAAGVGAALLSAICDTPPEWDRFLLLSLAAPTGVAA